MGVARTLAAAACAGLHLLAGLTGAAAQEFYAGRTITIVVGFTAGGGFDINARLLARHIGRHIPGKPDVIVSNMPGAASLTALRHLEALAPKDGTVITTFNFGHIAAARLTPEKVPVDFRKLAWIGSISQDLSVCYVWHKLPVRTLGELQASWRKLNFGLTSPGANEDIHTRILRRILGVEVAQISGYPGSAEQRIAIQRGELDGGCGSWNSLPADWIRDKLITPLYRTAAVVDPDMPAGLPFILDLTPDARARAIVALMIASNQLGRPFVASAAVPPERLALLRAAFEATVKDPQLLADAAKLRQPVSPKSATEAMRVIESIYEAPDDIAAAAREIATQ